MWKSEVRGQQGHMQWESTGRLRLWAAWREWKRHVLKGHFLFSCPKVLDHWAKVAEKLSFLVNPHSETDTASVCRWCPYIHRMGIQKTAVGQNNLNWHQIPNFWSLGFCITDPVWVLEQALSSGMILDFVQGQPFSLLVSFCGSEGLRSRKDNSEHIPGS
jgi:hypothetical protein